MLQLNDDKMQQKKSRQVLPGSNIIYFVSTDLLSIMLFIAPVVV